MRSHFSTLALGTVLLSGYGAEARAGVITSFNTVRLPGFSTGSVGPVGGNPAPNNDNSGEASPNTFAYSIFFNSFGLAEVEYVVADSGGTTEYFISQNLVNNSRQPWSGFRFELGFGTGENFVRAGTEVALDFDIPDADPAPFSSVFTVLDHQSRSISWSGGTVPSIGVVRFQLSIDVPDGLGSWNPGGASRFTLRQEPISAASQIPEPSSVILIAGGLLAVSAMARKSRTRSLG
jgi:hypothetical protein